MRGDEVYQAVADRTGLNRNDVKKAVNGLFDVVAGTVAQGKEKVTLTGFLSFEQVQRKARTARNPRTGEPIKVPKSKAVKVTAGSKLKDIVSGKAARPAAGAGAKKAGAKKAGAKKPAAKKTAAKKR